MRRSGSLRNRGQRSGEGGDRSARFRCTPDDYPMLRGVGAEVGIETDRAIALGERLSGWCGGGAKRRHLGRRARQLSFRRSQEKAERGEWKRGARGWGRASGEPRGWGETQASESKSPAVAVQEKSEEGRAWRVEARGAGEGGGMGAKHRPLSRRARQLLLRRSQEKAERRVEARWRDGGGCARGAWGAGCVGARCARGAWGARGGGRAGRAIA